MDKRYKIAIKILVCDIIAALVSGFINRVTFSHGLFWFDAYSIAMGLLFVYIYWLKIREL